MTGTDVVPYDPEKYRRDRRRVERSFWPKIRRMLGQVPLVEDALAAYYCAMDRDTPAYVRAVLMSALAYFVVPSDLAPDFLAVVGFTDDAAVIAIAINTVAPHIKDHHRDKARRALEERNQAGPEQESV